ncbi:MAG TPA: protein translocase subunit SecF [Gemmatimonadaceae bacterium]|nr:protein translocase subunit SecF [Gemmatimonadaceae bacterium]
MLRLLHGTNYDFIKWWKVMAISTIAWIVLGLGILAYHVAEGRPAVNYSIEFLGGTLMQVHFAQPPQIDDIRATVEQAGFAHAEIAQFGTPNDYTIRAQGTASVTDSTAIKIERALKDRYSPTGVSVGRREYVGARVGAELRRNAIIAILISFVVTLIYLAIRFEWRFGLAAVIATAHDIFTTLTFLLILRLEVSLTVVAAILTVIGYSLNDTIIIFDRVRENLRKQRKEPLRDVLNRSINETLPRSIMTHATTLAATLALLFFAGEVIRPFSWVMSFGIFTGTFSSIYVAGALLLYIERRWPRTEKSTARAIAEERRRERAEPRPDARDSTKGGKPVAAR